MRLLNCGTISPAMLDLSEPGCPERIAAREDPAKWNFPDLDALWMGEAAGGGN